VQAAGVKRHFKTDKISKRLSLALRRTNFQLWDSSVDFLKYNSRRSGKNRCQQRHLYPASREAGEKPCRKEDRDQIPEKLQNAGIANPNVFLICIKE
jgi:hypothetical protein